MIHCHFCPFNLEFYGRSLWYRLNQCTYFLYWLFDDDDKMRCRIWCNFVIKQPVQKKNKCIDRVYIKLIDCRIQDRMNKMTMNWPLCQKTNVKCGWFYFLFSNIHFGKQQNNHCNLCISIITVIKNKRKILVRKPSCIIFTKSSSDKNYAVSACQISCKLLFLPGDSLRK